MLGVRLGFGSAAAVPPPRAQGVAKTQGCTWAPDHPAIFALAPRPSFCLAVAAASTARGP
jgi:hypothetical protein